MRSNNLSRLYIVIISDFYKTFNTNTFEVDIIVLAILKFIAKETEIWQSEMTWLKTKTNLKLWIQFEFYTWYFF